MLVLSRRVGESIKVGDTMVTPINIRYGNLVEVAFQHERKPFRTVSSHIGQTIDIGNGSELSIQKVGSNKVVFGIAAPAHIDITRPDMKKPKDYAS